MWSGKHSGALAFHEPRAKQIFSDTGMIVQFEKPDLVVQTIREAWEQSKQER
jgi:hypothetical protein